MKLLPIESVAALLGLSVNTVRNCINNPKYHHLIPRPLPRNGIERRRFWDASTVEAWIAENPRQNCTSVETALFSTRGAAEFLDTTEHVLRTARLTGQLWGLPAPEFLRGERTIRYRREALIRFIESMTPCVSGAASSAARRREAAK